MPGHGASTDLQHGISIVTVGVSDLEASKRFYEQLGWPISPLSDPVMCTFVVTPTVVLGLVPWSVLEGDSGLTADRPSPGRFGGFTLAINGKDRAHVDEILERAVAAGGQLHKPATEQDWGGYPGYSGYFLDPDGHPWEVAYAPFLDLTPDGALAPPAR